MFFKKRKAPEVHFEYELRSQGDVKTLMEKLLDYEEAHMSENFNNLNHIETYYNLKMCIEEMALNVFQHGYKDASITEPRVKVHVFRTPERIQVDVSDNAQFFNPLADRPAPAMSEVTLGVDLVKKLVQELTYTRLDTGNKVSFYVNL